MPRTPNIPEPPKPPKPKASERQKLRFLHEEQEYQKLKAEAVRKEARFWLVFTVVAGLVLAAIVCIF